MKVELTTKKLYTDDGRFLKTIYCPKEKEWQELSPLKHSNARHCDSCSCAVHDTKGMSDADLVQLLKTDPKACLAISITQENCTIVPGRIEI
jgi:hypothetical protein